MKPECRWTMGNRSPARGGFRPNVSFCAILCHLIAGGTVGLHLSGGLAGLNLAMKSQKCARNETAGEWSQTVPSWLAGGDAGLSCKEE